MNSLMNRENTFSDYLTVLCHQIWSPMPRKLENGKFCQGIFLLSEEPFGLQNKIHQFHNPKNSVFRYIIMLYLLYLWCYSKILFNLEDTSDQSYGNLGKKWNFQKIRKFQKISENFGKFRKITENLKFSEISSFKRKFL